MKAISGDCFANAAIRSCFVDTFSEFRCIRRVSQKRFHKFDVSLPSTGSPEGSEFPSFAGTIKTLRRPAAILPHFVSFAWQYLGCTRYFAPRRTSAPPRPGVGNPVSPAGNSPRSEQGSPKFLGNLMSVCTCSKPTPAGLFAPDRFSVAAWPLNPQVQRLPRLGLSALNSMAFGLAAGTVPNAWSASQCGLLRHHARLASSCWSGSTGRAFHPQGSYERFQSCQLHLILLSQALLGAMGATHAPKTQSVSSVGRFLRRTLRYVLAGT